MLLGCGQEGGCLKKVLLDINPFPSFSVNRCREASATHYVSLWGASSSETVSPGQYGGRKRVREEKWENERGAERGEDLSEDRGREEQSRTKRKKQERR